MPWAPAVPEQAEKGLRLGSALLCSLTYAAEKELLGAVQTGGFLLAFACRCTFLGFHEPCVSQDATAHFLFPADMTRVCLQQNRVFPAK